jgi:hypothetical protein
MGAGDEIQPGADAWALLLGQADRCSQGKQFTCRGLA